MRNKSKWRYNMSQVNDIKNTVLSQPLTKEQQLDLFISIASDLEWDLFDIDYDKDDWVQKEKEATSEYLFK